MELHVIKDADEVTVVLLDSNMKIIMPVFNFLKFQKQKNKATNTIIANGRDLYLFWTFLEKYGYLYDQVTPSMIAEFIDYLRFNGDGLALYKESERTSRTINRILSTVHSFYECQADLHGVESPMLSHARSRPFNMFKGILEHARTDNRTKQSIFKVKESNYAVHLVTDKEMELVLSKLTKRRDVLLYKMLYLTGARIQEILDLEIEAIPIPDVTKSIGVLQQIKSKGKHRDLYVPMSLIEELDTYILEERSKIETENSYLFVSEQKKQLGKQLTYSAAYDKLKKVQAEVGVNFNFHDLRHTFCSSLIESGMDISVAKIIMGHENISTTQKYTHLSGPYIEKSLANYWSKSSLIGGQINAE